MGIRCRTKFNNIGAYVTRIRDVARSETRNVANDLRDAAVANAPKRTGALAASIYVVTDLGSDYGDRISEALALQPTMDLFPEEEQGADGSAFVAVAAGYGGFIEDGTVSQEAQPFIAPAVAQLSESLETRFARVISEDIGKE